ncbi:hypothetical protein WMY93_021896 [Mugilogobius chulae]|uniref:Nucleoporin Nup159/Nup146 N-terminal domain-containing protein n=1 Tax=Mugilogobius chulae TaxID=88201 RepID=A0AAW0NGA0_9GOBI
MSDDTDSPPEREMKDFQFRQMKKVRVFDAPEELPRDRSNLLAVSNKFGFTFVGFGSILKVFLTQDILAVDKVDGNANEIICWSPKGKQIAAGKMDATVSQYTPTLEEKKRIPCPNFYTSDNPVKVLDVLWLRTFVFAVVYAAADGSPETPPDLVVVSLPKKDEKVETKYLNFSDPVYGSCTERQHHYFLSQIEDWDLFFAASAASLEVCPIARQDDKNWELWILEDSSRAELPVTETSDDTFPLGLAIDFTNQQDIRISDEKVLPPAPVMLLLSTHGLLCPFALLNMNPGVKQLVSPASPLSVEGERPPKTGLAAAQKPPPALAPVAPAPIPASVAPAPPAPTALPAAPFGTTPAPPVSSSGFTFSIPSTSTSSALSAFSLGNSTPLVQELRVSPLCPSPRPKLPLHCRRSPSAPRPPNL